MAWPGQALLLLICLNLGLGRHVEIHRGEQLPSAALLRQKAAPAILLAAQSAGAKRRRRWRKLRRRIANFELRDHTFSFATVSLIMGFLVPAHIFNVLHALDEQDRCASFDLRPQCA